MIYYRVAWKMVESSPWRWRSTKLESLHAVLGVLNLYRAMRKDALRIFYASSVEILETMLDRENQRQASNSVGGHELLHREISPINMRRLEMEIQTAGDRDVRYVFDLSITLRQKLAWMQLMNRVRAGTLVS
jgi:hypothetical protein